MTGTIRTAIRATLAAIALGAMLVACSPTAPAPSVTPLDTPSASGEPSTTPTPVVETPVPLSLSAEDRAALVDGLRTGNPASIGPHLAEPVAYILASSECCGPITPEDAVGELLAYAGGASGWVTPIDMVYLDRLRASPYYADYVPADVVAARASDGLVVVFGITDDKVTSILVGDEDVLLY